MKDEVTLSACLFMKAQSFIEAFTGFSQQGVHTTEPTLKVTKLIFF